MKKTKIIIALSIVAIVIVAIIMLLFHKKEPEKRGLLQIKLKGEKIIHLTLDKRFIDPGYTAYDTDGKNITTEVVVSQFTMNKVGTYVINYEVTNKQGEKAKASRFIIVDSKYLNVYDEIDNGTNSWWSNNKKDGTRPTGGYDIQELQKFNATFLGPDEKVLYLTFDEGSNNTYVEEIADVLTSNQIKGTFFFCKNFIVTHPTLMKKLSKAGHSVGNHTASHKQMSQYATKENYTQFLAEIEEVEEAFKGITGKQLDKVYRDPKGEWSKRSLKLVQDLGYKTFFYSADYLDWDGEVSKEYALEQLKKRVHNGAIYLIHPVNKGNYLALDSFIKDMKKEGYRFDLVKNISFSEK